MKIKCLLVGMLMLTAVLAQSQTATNKLSIPADSIFTPFDTITKLRTVVIEAKENAFKEIRRIDQVDGVIIYAGKKNEIIDVQKANANIALNQPRQVFAKVPGLMIWENDGSGIQTGISSRGLSPNRSWEFNTRQNGYDISSDPYGYPEAYYTPPLEAVQSVEFVRGGSSLQFGCQFGGLLNYRLKNPNPTKPIAYEGNLTFGSYGMLNTYQSVSGTKGKFSYIGYFNFRRANGWRANSGYNYGTGYAQANYTFKPGMTLRAEFTRMNYIMQQPGGLTDSMFVADPRQSLRSRNWMNIESNIPALTFNWVVNKNFTIDAKAFGLIGERNSVGFTSNVASNTGVVTADNNGNRQVDRDFYKNIGAELRTLFTYKLLGKEQTLAGGVRYFRGNTVRQRGDGSKNSNFDLTYLKPDSLRRNFDFVNTNAAVFVENIFRVGNRITITPGLRFEHIDNTSTGQYFFNQNFAFNNQASRNFLLAGVGASVITSETTLLYANFSQAYRPVLFADLTPAVTSDVIDPNLRDANGHTTDIGYRGNIKEWLNFDVSLFYLTYNNRIGRVTVEVDSTTSYQLVTNVANSQTAGLEYYVEFSPVKLIAPKAKWGNISMFVSGTFQQPYYLDPNANTTKPGKNYGNRIENAPGRIIRGGLTYSYRDIISTTFQVSNVDFVYSDANNTETSKTGNAGIIPAYTVADLSAAAKFAKHYSIRAGVNNLFDAKYFTRRAGGYPGPGLIPADGRTLYLTLGVNF